MPLTLEELRSIQADCLADDVPIDFEKMSHWSLETATAFFQNGGELEPAPPPTMQGLHALPDAKLISGAPLAMSSLAGKPCFIMNVASRWGSTGRGYKLLKDLHEQFGARLEIMIFPSDEFGQQELPEAQVGAFCESRGVPREVDGCHLMAKTLVNGPSADPIWRFAKQAFPGEVKWNFDGIFLFRTDGSVASRHSIRAPPSMDHIRSLL